MMLFGDKSGAWRSTRVDLQGAEAPLINGELSQVSAPRAPAVGERVEIMKTFGQEEVESKMIFELRYVCIR